MATQTVEFMSPGTPSTVRLVARGTDTITGTGASVTQRTNAPGRWTCTFTDAPAATYGLAVLDSGGNAIAEWDVALTLTTATFYAYEPLLPTIAVNAASAATDAAAAGVAVLNATTIATLSSQKVFTLTAGSADDDAYNDAAVIVVDQSTATQKALSYVADYVGSTRTVKLLEAPGFTIATGDSVYVIANIEAARVNIDATLTSSAGTACHIAAWLEWRGRRVNITGDTCSVVFQQLDQDTALFTVTESDVLGSAAIEENVFRLLKSTPGFTDDRQYLVTATITHNGRAFQGTALIPALGGA